MARIAAACGFTYETALTIWPCVKHHAQLSHTGTFTKQTEKINIYEFLTLIADLPFRGTQPQKPAPL